MEDRISHTHLSTRSTNSLPAHLFGLKSKACVLSIEQEFDENFKLLLNCLKKQGVTAFLQLLGEFASRFIRLMDEKQEHSLYYIDAYNSIVHNFLAYYQRHHQINSEWVKNNLHEKALIEYAKLSSHCINTFSEYQNQAQWTPEEISQFARFYVIKPFILNLLPIDEAYLHKLKQQHLELNFAETTRFNAMINNHVLGADGQDQLIRQRLEQMLIHELDRLISSEKQSQQWYCFWLKPPTNKINRLNHILKASQEPIKIAELGRIINSTQADENFNQHRNLFVRSLGKLFTHPPCTCTRNLSKFYQEYFSAFILADKIGQRLV
jgi:hypothetical protein